MVVDISWVRVKALRTRAFKYIPDPGGLFHPLLIRLFFFLEA